MRYYIFFQLCTIKKEFRPNVSTSHGDVYHGNCQRMCSQSMSNSDIVSQSSHSSIASSHWIGLKRISESSSEMDKIKKVQSFFRGWLCRRRWKQIVEQYIKSPHAESMRKRNR
jgi:hypothetical protein